MQLSKRDVIAHANSICKNTLMETLNIEFIDFGDDFVVAKILDQLAVEHNLQPRWGE